MMKLFISYSTQDGIITKDLLSQVKNFYSKYGNCYIDLLDNDSIDKQKRVYLELYKADILILLHTPASDKSKWVQKEIYIAYKRNIPIIIVNNSNLKMLLHSHKLKTI
ncbi:toll/interleukin-1 receptor domain-containing protein [uncultured Parabacteroides sp.]|uniref:toll/interleukin-1 receptor domain-containing protein n=1 Tax=uncultured Parabacteroides sp. TaxID=512312 RepID=UPI00258B7F94|nr:toll/interleukin-1 receptor domain-containing protein [uncultured Parabacteroides sp.]